MGTRKTGNMATSERFENAIAKLYNAFHTNQLNPECCNHCAVGNICDNTDTWKNLTDAHGSTKLNYVGIVNENFGRRFNGYKPSELLQIEAAFLTGCGYSLPLNQNSKKPTDTDCKNMLFDGLCAVVTFLCHLEEIPDIMDCEGLFDFDPSAKTTRPEELVP